MENKTYTRKMFLNDMLQLDLTPEQRECAEKWLAALSKKSETPRVNKTRIENESLARKTADAIRESGETLVNAKWISEHVSGILTPQKAVGVARVAIELGLIVRIEEKGKAFYRLA